MNARSESKHRHEKDAVSSQSPGEYYECIAPDYDEARFGNSYGQYLDCQERRVLRRWLAPYRNGAILDLACGTGRLLDLATHGLDASAAMVREAERKFPGRPLHCGPAQEVARLGIQFDAVFCLHLFMHLPQEEIEVIARECASCVRRGGALIVDAPSAWRRRLARFQPTGWHGATSFTANQVRAITGAEWRLRAVRGVLFFPLHRVPRQLRRWFRPADDFLGATPLKWLSSYNLYRLERQ
jgi:2-polyprenyl-3-methyl-5-hydroxy-6-metoxy-1,4-benzoquinol methylase